MIKHVNMFVFYDFRRLCSTRVATASTTHVAAPSSPPSG